MFASYLPGSSVLRENVIYTGRSPSSFNNPREVDRGSSMRIVSVAALLAVILLSATYYSPTTFVVSGSPSHGQAISVSKFTLTEWNVSTRGGGPVGIAFDQTGKIWTTENSSNKIASLDPSHNTFTEWNITTPISQPRNIFVTQVLLAGGSVTQVFFTEYASNKIARFDIFNKNFTEWQLPAGSKPVGIYVDENADVWFTESGRDIIGRLTPSTNSLTEWSLPGATASPGVPVLQPWGIYIQVVSPPTSASNRFVWFTESLNNKIGRLEANSNRLTLWDLGALGLGVYQPAEIKIATVSGFPVAVFSNLRSNKISILGNDTAGGSVYEDTLIPTSSALPEGAAFDSARNAFWFAENNCGSYCESQHYHHFRWTAFNAVLLHHRSRRRIPIMRRPSDTSFKHGGGHRDSWRIWNLPNSDPEYIICVRLSRSD